MTALSPYMRSLKRRVAESMRVRNSIKGPDPATNTFLVVVVGHEGIGPIIGLFDREGAVARMTSLKARSVNPDDYCVQRVDAGGAKCCCHELGFEPTETRLY